MDIDNFHVSAEITTVLQGQFPIVALETTVLTHGLPYPQNLQLAQDMEAQVRKLGATPATIGVIDGVIQVGLDEKQLDFLVTTRGLLKVSRRDFATAIAKKMSGGTTVAGTLIAAHAAGIQVFATGGIGGVHRQPAYDVSADLPELARRPVIVVCAGAKAILDLPATLEYLETLGVPVVGYQTDEFAALQFAQRRFEVAARPLLLRHVRQHTMLKHSPDDRGRLQRALVPPRQAVNAGRDHPLHRIRYHHVLDGLSGNHLLSTTHHQAGINQRPQQFLQEEGIPLGLVQDQLAGLSGQVLDP